MTDHFTTKNPARQSRNRTREEKKDFTAKNAKGAKNKKFEARKRPRGPKFETISND